MSNSTDMVTKILFVLVSALILAAVINNFYTFYFKKDYNFTVEASCDPAEQACFNRSCGEGSECPPNGLEVYRVFTLKAGDFDKCSNDSCLAECTSGSIQCEEVLCDGSSEDTCTVISTVQ